MLPTRSPIVAYYRVSTAKQGDSGLGLEAQRRAVAEYVARTGGYLAESFQEIESGMKDDLSNRPQLRAAIAYAKKKRGKLVIAKLDRLMRSTVVSSALKLSKVPFVACDNPDANELTIDILVAVAANEGRQISQRTKAALAAYKARGGVLGGARPGSRPISQEARREGARRSAERRKAEAREAYSEVLPIVESMRSEGATLKAIAERLNAEGQTTRNDRPWSTTQVLRLLSRYTHSNPK